MICDCRRRDVACAGDSFWHRDARICRECFALWGDPANDEIESTDYASIGNYVRLRHGLPPIVAALAVMALGLATTAQASRYCLDHAEAARTWPTRALAKDGDGCWTYDHHKPRLAEAAIPASETPRSKTETIAPPPENEGWPETDLVQLEPSEPELIPDERPSLGKRHLALFVSLVLAVASVIEVATGRPGSAARAAGRWPTGKRNTLGLQDDLKRFLPLL
jgi:hypothetical protein